MLYTISDTKCFLYLIDKINVPLYYQLVSTGLIILIYAKKEMCIRREK